MVRPNPYVAYGAVATGSASALATANQRFAQKFLAESEARMQREAATAQQNELAPVDTSLTADFKAATAKDESIVVQTRVQHAAASGQAENISP